jgi:hypothetical protein
MGIESPESTQRSCIQQQRQNTGPKGWRMQQVMPQMNMEDNEQ